MKRWKKEHGYVECPKADAFIADILEVYKKHGLAISHEDTQGCFEIVTYDDGDGNQKWLEAATDRT